jgi:hypothetical protein
MRLRYTRKEHDIRLAAYQRLLDELLKLSEANGLIAGERKALVASLSTGGTIKVRHTIPFSEIRFFMIEWGGDLTDQHEAVNLEYQADTRTVSDSTQWYEDGSYAHVGHIQCWRSLSRTDEMSFLESLIALITSLEGKWSLVISEDRRPSRIII